MSLSYKKAYQAASEPFVLVWVDSSGLPMLYFDETKDLNFPSGEIVWANMHINFIGRKQVTFADYHGQKSYEITGQTMIDVFSPVMKGVNVNGLDVGLDACQAVVDAYSKNNGCMWFKEPKMKNKGNDGAFYKFTIFVDFVYYDLI
jgi:hypothetical protein